MKMTDVEYLADKYETRARNWGRLSDPSAQGHAKQAEDAAADFRALAARLAADQQKGGGEAVPEWWPRFVANAAASLDTRGDRQMAARMMELHSAMTATTDAEHDLWKTGEIGVPSSIVDRNGDVTLALCKACGQGEGDIEPTCPTPQPSIPAPAQQGPVVDEAVRS